MRDVPALRAVSTGGDSSEGLGHEAYPLRTVARLTGLSPDLIRAWEKRYSVVAPRRGPRGARLYSAADMAHLRLLARAVAGGRAIGDIARLSRAELEALAATPAPESPRLLEASRPDDRSAIVQRALDAVKRFDVAELDQALGEALLVLGATNFIRQIISPLLSEIGERWQRGALSIGDEHLVSTLLRNLLGGLLRSRPTAQRPELLLAAPQGERHEFGLLLVAVRAVDAGVGVSVLGVDLPADEIASAARRAGVKAVGLGLVNGDNCAAAGRQISILERGLPQEVELWLGGPQARTVAQLLGATRAIVLDQEQSLEAEMQRLRSLSAAKM